MASTYTGRCWVVQARLERRTRLASWRIARSVIDSELLIERAGRASSPGTGNIQLLANPATKPFGCAESRSCMIRGQRSVAMAESMLAWRSDLLEVLLSRHK
jgi:hypothetical protein